MAGAVWKLVLVHGNGNERVGQCRRTVSKTDRRDIIEHARGTLAGVL